MFFKKIEKNQDNTNVFQKTIEFNGNKTINGNSLLFTYCNLDDTTKPFGNLFRSLKLPITDQDFTTFDNMYKNTAFKYLGESRKAIVVEIPKGEYGELIDGKTFTLTLPILLNSVNKLTTLYGTYFNFNDKLNSQLSDNNSYSENFGYKPTTDNDNNSNITYLFSNDISEAVGDVVENIQFGPELINVTQTELNAVTGITPFTSFTVTANDIIFIEVISTLRNPPFGGVPVECGIKNYSGIKLEPNTIQTIPQTVTTNENLIIYKLINSNQSVQVKITKYTPSTLQWSQYTTTNKFPTNVNDLSGKRYAKFSGTTSNPFYDKPVGILYQDKGVAVILNETLVNNIIFSGGVSSGYNNITSGNSYTSDTNFVKIYFPTTSAETKFNSITTEYTQNVYCIGMPNEFYQTTNSTFTDAYDENITEKPVFITSIGFYNKYGELIGIGKTSEPIKKTKNNIIPFNIKLKI